MSAALRILVQRLDASLLLLLAACGSAPASSAAPAAVNAARLPATAAGLPPEPPLPALPPAAPEPEPLAVVLRRELEVSVTAIAVERAPFVAAVARDAVWMHEARGWHEEALPPSARGLPFAVFYGRDNRVRLVRVGAGDAAAKGLYMRWKPEGFRDAPEELGKLAGMPRPLVSVLGNDDPEIVCLPGDMCLVKRRSGWTYADAPADLTRVTLGEGVGWGVAGVQLLRLGEGWERVGPPGEWRRADALFATRDRAWVIETATARVHSFDGAAWRSSTVPVTGPRAIWGARPDALWLAGEGGLAFFDGKVWRRVTDAPAPLTAVAGRGDDDVWIGGEHGLYRIEPRR